MSALTDVIQHPATAAAELQRLRAEVDVLRAERDALRERNRRMVRALRAIDTRLHNEAELVEPDTDSGPYFDVYCALSPRTLRQMCNVAVSATAERP